jgi:ribosomal protein S18 acetylase RimI-like enzyme
MSRLQIVHLPESRLDEAAQALTEAFIDDPLQSYTFPDVAVRQRSSPAHFAALLRYGLLAGHVLTAAEHGAGASVWLPPGSQGTPEMAEQSGLTKLPELLGAEAARRFGSVIEFVEAFHHRVMPDPHWYTMVLGVSPAFQGQGYGRALLQPFLEQASRDGVSCYLETTQPRNVGFYQRMGFWVLDEQVEPQSGLRIWAFRRDPTDV